MPSKSQTSELAAVAIQPHRRTSSTGMSTSAFAARCNAGVAAACPVGGQQREAVEQQVEGTRTIRRRREGLDGAADLQQDAAFGEMPRHTGCTPGGQVGLAREIQVERLEPSRGLEQQQREHRCPRPEAKATWPRSRSTRARWNSSSGPASAVASSPSAASNVAGLEARLRRGQSAIGPPRRVLRQRDRALQERRRGGEPAARLRPAGRALELHGDLLVRSRRGRSQMPRTTVRVGLSIGRLRQRQMDRPAILHRRRPVHRRAHQRMPERHPLADRQQPVRLRGLRGRRPDPEPLGRAPQQQRIADRLRRRDQQQTPRVLRERLESSDEALLDPSSQRLRAQQTEAARQLRRRQPPRQLEQRQRIPARLGDDPVPDPLIQLEPHCRARATRGRRRCAPRRTSSSGTCRSSLARLARGEHDPDRLRQQATGDEGQRQRRGLIQPLRVVDDTQQRTLLGHLREQAQHRQPDEEPIRGSAGAQPEHDLHGLPLRRRELLEPVEQRPAQLMQAGEGQLHVRLHPHRPHDGQIRRRRDQVLQQRRLPDPGLAAQHQRPALAATDRRDQVVQQRALARPAAQAGAPGRSARTAVHR